MTRIGLIITDPERYHQLSIFNSTQIIQIDLIAVAIISDYLFDQCYLRSIFIVYGLPRWHEPFRVPVWEIPVMPTEPFIEGISSNAGPLWKNYYGGMFNQYLMCSYKNGSQTSYKNLRYAVFVHNRVWESKRRQTQLRQ